MHDKYGNMPMVELFQPAIDLAINGFPLGGRSYGLASFLFGLLNSDCDQRLFFRDPTAFAYMVNSETCEIKPPGTNMTNPEYAATLEKIATLGAIDGFYKGEVAAAIAAAAQSDLGIFQEIYDSRGFGELYSDRARASMHRFWIRFGL